MLNCGNFEGRYDTFESYNDQSYHFNRESNRDIFNDDYTGESDTSHEHFTDSKHTMSKSLFVIFFK